MSKPKAHALKKNLRGVVLAMITPMNEDYSLDLDGMARNIDVAINDGIVNGRGGFIVGGSGGELAHLTLDERKQLIKTTVEAAAGRAPVLLAVQDSGTQKCIDLAQYAEKVGADGLQLGPPCHYEHPEGDDKCFFEDIDKEIGIGVMIYNTWWLCAHIRPEFLSELADLETVVACKWSVPLANRDLRRGYELCADRISMIDNSVSHIETHILGAVGAVSCLGDFWVKFDLDIWDMLEAGEYKQAAEKLRKVNHPYYVFRDKVSCRTGGETSVKKPAAALVGNAAGPTRPPCRDLTEEEFAELREMFIGFGVPNMKVEASCVA